MSCASFAEVADSYPATASGADRGNLPPNIADLEKCMGPAHDELQLPMDIQSASSDKLDARASASILTKRKPRSTARAAIVFDNHDKAAPGPLRRRRSQRPDQQGAVATLLFTTRATALMYYGEEIGMVTTTPARQKT